MYRAREKDRCSVYTVAMIRRQTLSRYRVYSERRRSRKKQKRGTTFAGGEGRKGLARRWRAVFLLHSNTDWDMLS